jgi:hypothetical protein
LQVDDGPKRQEIYNVKLLDNRMSDKAGSFAQGEAPTAVCGWGPILAIDLVNVDLLKL